MPVGAARQKDGQDEGGRQGRAPKAVGPERRHAGPSPASAAVRARRARSLAPARPTMLPPALHQRTWKVIGKLTHTGTFWSRFSAGEKR